MSEDRGLTWTHLGIVLDEPWHLSYPFLFRWEGQMYMMPEASKQVLICTVGICMLVRASCKEQAHGSTSRGDSGWERRVS